MTIRQVQLVAPTQIAGAATTYLTVPANTTYRIGRAGFSNPSGAAIPITVYLVPAAGAASAANELIDAVNVPAGSTYVSPELAGLVMPAGSTLQALAGTAGVVVLYASGVSIQ
jgi:hypothetical protein